MQRRFVIKSVFLILATLKMFPAAALDAISQTSSNFKRIYSNTSLKSNFYKFLKNVFNLFPEDDFHDLISEVTKDKNNDKEIYVAAQSKLAKITPTFSISPQPEECPEWRK